MKQNQAGRAKQRRKASEAGGEPHGQQDNEKDKEIVEEELPMMHERLSAYVGQPVKGPNFAGVNCILEHGMELSFNLFCAGRYYLRFQRALNRELKLMCERHQIALAVPRVAVTEKTVKTEQPEYNKKEQEKASMPRQTRW